MYSRIVGSMFTAGSGIVFSRLYLDVIAVLALLYVARNLLVPVIRSYRLAKFLDQLCGGEARHWFYGHLLKYPFTEAGLLAIADRARRFPYICSNWVGPFIPEVMVFHPDSVKAVMASYAPKSEIAYRVMRPWIGDGLLTSSGRKWQRNRRLITPAFHYNILKPYLKIFNDSARIFLNNFKSEVGNPVEISERISWMTLDTMLKCAMSFETDCQDIEGKHPYVAAVKEITSLVLKRIENPILLIDWVFFLTSNGRRFKKATGVVHDEAEKIIAQRRKILADKSSATENSKQKEKKYLDFLDILLETKDEDGKGLTDQEIRDEVDTFLFEGHDTTASALTWISYNLAKYPEFQEQCREEVTGLFQGREDVEWKTQMMCGLVFCAAVTGCGRDQSDPFAPCKGPMYKLREIQVHIGRSVQWRDDLSQLHYLTMFIKESMRLRPPVPGIGRYLNAPLSVPKSNKCDVIIPQHANVVIPIFAVHRNPGVWEDPEIFDPQRFTLENISKRPPHAFVPFSAGPRNCIGQNFAMNEIKTVVCQLLATYRLSLDRDTDPPVMKPQLVLGTEGGMFVKFEAL